jgi:hypothetical protein
MSSIPSTVSTDSHFLHEIGDDTPVRDFKDRLGLEDEFILNNYPDELMAILGLEE